MEPAATVRSRSFCEPMHRFHSFGIPIMSNPSLVRYIVIARVSDATCLRRRGRRY